MRSLLLVITTCLLACAARAQDSYELAKPMAFMTRHGAIRLALDADTVATLKKQGWKETARPQQHPHIKPSLTPRKS